MLIIGLTGSIATGKSTVSRLLSSPPYSLQIIDADILAREAIAPGSKGYATVLERFAGDTPDLLMPQSDDMPESGPDGKGRPINRAVLGRRVFGNDEERVRDRHVLNGIVHPAVRHSMVQKVLGAYVSGARAVVLDVPLLFESGLDIYCGVVIVVGVRDAQVQLQRLLQRDREQNGSLTEDEARRRVESQGSVQGKVERCRVRGGGWAEVVWNDKDRDELEKRVEVVMNRVLARSPEWWETLMWAFPPLALGIAAWGMFYGVIAKKKYEEMQKSE